MVTLNFYLYLWPFIHCLYFIYTRRFYVRSQGKITRQWKSTLTGSILVFTAACFRHQSFQIGWTNPNV